MTIDVQQIQLKPVSSKQLLALMEGEDKFFASSGLTAADGLRGFFVSDDVSPEFIKKLDATEGIDTWQFGFIVVDATSSLAIGCAGFKGPPDDQGVVEIAYGIVPDFENQGFATKAASELLKFAFNDKTVRKAIAHTLPEANASTRVLTKNGFEKTAEVEDPEDGFVWRWELRKK